MKEKTFNRVKQEFPEQFQGSEWSDIPGDDELSLKATAYYLKSLEEHELADAPLALRQKYSPLQVMAGIYNIGEKNYRETAYRSGSFGPAATWYITAMFGDEASHSGGFMATSTAAICSSQVFTCGH